MDEREANLTAPLARPMSLLLHVLRCSGGREEGGCINRARVGDGTYASRKYTGLASDIDWHPWFSTAIFINVDQITASTNQEGYASR